MSSRGALAALALFVAGCGQMALPGAPAPAGLVAQRLPESHGTGELKLHILPAAGDGVVLDALRRAKKRVRLQVYMLTHAGVIDALVAAKKRGVEVQVLLEPRPFNPSNPSVPLPTNQAAARRLLAEGVAVRWAGGGFRYTHAKAMTVDDATTYVSTANFTKSGLGTSRSGAREYIVADTSPSDVAEFTAMFEADWEQRAYVPSDEDLIVSPSNARERLMAMLRSARSEIRLAVEVAGDPALDALIAERAAAGVKVRALLADIEANRRPAAAWTRAGASVRIQRAPHLHAKTFVVDGALAYVGSVNMTTNSMDANRELGLRIATRAVITGLTKTIDADWAQALPPEVARFQTLPLSD